MQVTRVIRSIVSRTGAAHQTVTLMYGRDVTLQRVSPHPEYRLEAILKVYSTKDFARKYRVSDSRIRQLIAEDRVFPRQRLDNGRYIMFANSVSGPVRAPEPQTEGSRIRTHESETPATDRNG